jgi:hypothetical protein
MMELGDEGGSREGGREQGEMEGAGRDGNSFSH